MLLLPIVLEFLEKPLRIVEYVVSTTAVALTYSGELARPGRPEEGGVLGLRDGGERPSVLHRVAGGNAPSRR